MKPFAFFPQLNNLNKYVSLINTKPVCVLSLLISAIQVKPYLCFSRFASVCCKLRWPHIVQGVGRTFRLQQPIFCHMFNPLKVGGCMIHTPCGVITIISKCNAQVMAWGICKLKNVHGSAQCCSHEGDGTFPGPQKVANFYF